MEKKNSSVIEVRDLIFQYPNSDNQILNRINLTICRGEFVAFIGQNGAGKTTLAKTFNGILKPTGGEVIVDGMNTQTVGLDKLARVVGYVYQNPDNQIFAPTVKEEVAFGPRNIGFSRDEIEKAVAHALKLVDMEKDADTYPFLLGRGQRQKLAVASVLAMGSPVMVVDEPTTGLDLAGSMSIMKLLKQWNRDGRTIIFITHDIEIVAEYADRTLVMSCGQILADGPTRDVLTDQDTLKKAFIKAPQVTRIAQQLHERFGFPKDILTLPEFQKTLKEMLNKQSRGASYAGRI